jgi:hypothetical protein
MPTPIREQVIAEMQTRLARLVASGECLRCRPYADETEFIAIWDGEEDAETEAFGRVKNTLPLAVVWSLKYTADDFATKLNTMLADLIKEVCLNGSAQFDKTLGGLASGVGYTGSSMKYPASGSAFISLGAVFTVEYPTKLGDPYSQP